MKINNKGFTLVEVIAVVGIITMLALILIPNVTGMISKQKKNSEDNIKQTILIAAEEYTNDNKYSIGISGTTVTLGTLIDSGYITPTKGNNIVNPNDKSKCLNNDIVVTVTTNIDANNKIKSYNYSVDINSSSWGNCS